VKRRHFLNTSLLAAVSWLRLSRDAVAADSDDSTDDADFRLTRQTPTRYYDGDRCWCHPRAGIVPGAGKDGAPRVVTTMNTLDTSGSDVFKAMYGFETDDLGRSWTQPRELPHMAVRYETIDGVERPVAVSDFWPTWHKQSGHLLGTGHTVVYTPDWHVRKPRPRHTSYSVYDPDQRQWRPWQKLSMPEGDKFHDSGAGCTQRVDLANGEILLPFYFRPPGKNSHVSVARCSFDGSTLRFVENGTELHIDDKTRGLHEPSLARFGGEYFLTLRNDKRGYVTRGRDGLNFEAFQPWRFDDDSELGNYNTQQHWVTHRDALYLVYNRRGANNDHVFRHRAPLFIAEVDTKRLRVIRDTERILVPERGARLGNFGVTHVSRDETWVTVAEWMQPEGVDKHGSDGSVWVARLHWKRPNDDV